MAAEWDGCGAFEVGGGVTLAPATEADFAELNADLREKDRAECRVFGRECDEYGCYERAWAYRYGGELLGVAGWTNFRDAGHLSRFRLCVMISTNAVNRHRLVYVKYSKAVFRKLVGLMPKWVEDLYALPMSSYAESIRWQERVLGMRKARNVLINGVEHTVMHIRREDV